MCQGLGTSPLFSARLLQLGFLKCDMPLIVMVGRGEAWARGEKSGLALGLVPSILNPRHCQGGRGKCWEGTAFQLERAEQPGGQAVACLPLSHLPSTQAHESTSFPRQAAPASLLCTSSMAGAKSQLCKRACAEYSKIRGHIVPEPRCQHVANTALKLAVAGSQTLLRPKPDSRASRTWFSHSTPWIIPKLTLHGGDPRRTQPTSWCSGRGCQRELLFWRPETFPLGWGEASEVHRMTTHTGFPSSHYSSCFLLTQTDTVALPRCYLAQKWYPLRGSDWWHLLHSRLCSKHFTWITSFSRRTTLRRKRWGRGGEK